MSSRIEVLRTQAILILAAGLLAACGGSTPTPEPTVTPTPPPPNAIAHIVDRLPLPPLPLTADSTPEQVIGLMLHSHTLWRTVQARATVRWLRSDGSYDVMTQSLTIEQFGRAHLEAGPEGAPPISAWVSDGETIWQIDRSAGTQTSGEFPPTFRSLEVYTPPTKPSGAIVRHPMDALIPSPLADSIYPLGTAQALLDQTVSLTGWEKVAGRDCVVIRAEQKSGDLLTGVWNYWVDAATGVVMRGQMLDPVEGANERVADEVSIDEIAFDAAIDPAEFVVK